MFIKFKDKIFPIKIDNLTEEKIIKFLRVTFDVEAKEIVLSSDEDTIIPLNSEILDDQLINNSIYTIYYNKQISKNVNAEKEIENSLNLPIEEIKNETIENNNKFEDQILEFEEEAPTETSQSINNKNVEMRKTQLTDRKKHLRRSISLSSFSEQLENLIKESNELVGDMATSDSRENRGETFNKIIIENVVSVWLNRDLWNTEISPNFKKKHPTLVLGKKKKFHPPHIETDSHNKNPKKLVKNHSSKELFHDQKLKRVPLKLEEGYCLYARPLKKSKIYYLSSFILYF